ncbi:4-hydroxy-tetrahydrodipicolinate reductase [Lacticaseibacillus baoqingensis]|uniref:4-hydroxy-tetrahydrodipicolinate reductase n=1 Tax=Lacticaseibacillus baoqingensis TaxID=2486013 RepID=A0ABW4E6J8_9LACO|nr:4-hydroxy-tetrahydrodipicolinate reductase [Lacticaseibacillus baoqingensis]
MINVIVAGFPGAMGQKVVKMLAQHDDFKLTAIFNPLVTDTDPASYQLASDVQILTDYAQIHPGLADVWVDFTTPKAVASNITAALNAGIHPVVGTSGMAADDQQRLAALAKAKHIGGLIAPNFGISAVLLMQFAAQAAKYFPDAEVIEMHHEDKLDAPSGTAKATAEMIAKARVAQPQPTTDDPAHGEKIAGVPVHAVRLPGYVAHEQVLFGAPGEALTIRQDSFDRESFMSGVAVAIAKVQTLDTLVIGLEHLL